MQKLEDLIAALEKAEGPSRWIDAKIDAAIRIGTISSDQRTIPIYLAPPAAVQEPVAVKVKPLEWKEPRPTAHYPEWSAGNLIVGFNALIDTHEPICFGKFPLKINGKMVKEKFSTVDAAKSFAQTKYEEMVREIIRSALSIPQSDPAPEINVRGLDRFAAAFQGGFTGGNGVWSETPEHHREMFREGIRSLLTAHPALSNLMSNLPDEKTDAPIENRPEWIWYCESTSGVPVVTFGRWAKHPQQVRYKLAEIQPTEHDHPTPAPREDHAPEIAALRAENERLRKISDTAERYITSVNGGPKARASDLAWKAYDDAKQMAFDDLRAAVAPEQEEAK